MPFALTFLGFPCFYYFLSACSLPLAALYLDKRRFSVSGIPPPPGRGAWPLAPSLRLPPGQAGSLGEFRLAVGLTGDGAAEHAGNLVSFLGPVLPGGDMFCSFPRCG